MESYLRIGAFSRKFQVSPSTVRYYVQLGLIIPDVQNNQHLFHQECLRDMEQVMKLKRMRFSLEEIHELITLNRKSHLLLDEELEPYMDWFRAQKKKLQKELRAKKSCITNIHALLAELPS